MKNPSSIERSDKRLFIQFESLFAYEKISRLQSSNPAIKQLNIQQNEVLKKRDFMWSSP